MGRIVDARTLACPQPVLLTKKALEEADEVTTIVDNEAARENVSRLGKSQGCEVSIEPKQDGIYLKLRKTGVQTVKQEESAVDTGLVVFITSDIVGRGGNLELGSLLMQSFILCLMSCEKHILWSSCGAAIKMMNMMVWDIGQI